MSDTQHHAQPRDATWHCPVCGDEVHHEFGPGRKRVYCTAACKQRAYRWRRQNGVRLLATPWQPAQRSGFTTAHAVRPAADFVGEQHDERGRHVAICGAFARRDTSPFQSHTEFVPGGGRSCRSCIQLIGADPSWAVDYPPGSVQYVGGRWDWIANSPGQRLAAYQARARAA